MGACCESTNNTKIQMEELKKNNFQLENKIEQLQQNNYQLNKKIEQLNQTIENNTMQINYQNYQYSMMNPLMYKPNQFAYQNTPQSPNQEKINIGFNLDNGRKLNIIASPYDKVGDLFYKVYSRLYPNDYIDINKFTFFHSCCNITSDVLSNKQIQSLEYLKNGYVITVIH